MWNVAHMPNRVISVSIKALQTKILLSWLMFHNLKKLTKVLLSWQKTSMQQVVFPFSRTTGSIRICLKDYLRYISEEKKYFANYFEVCMII